MYKLNTLIKSFFSGVIFYPVLIRNLMHGDTFYALALKRFYMRQFRLIKGELLFPAQLGRINRFTFLYQNFVAIYLCYKIMGRRLFVFISLAIYILLSMNLLKGEVKGGQIILMIIFLTSAINVFIIMERGNYQMFGIVTGVIASAMWLTSDKIESSQLALMVITLVFSTSSFLLLIITTIANLSNLWILALASSFSIVIFLMANIWYIKGRKIPAENEEWILLKEGVTKVLRIISGYNQKGSQKVIRRRTLLSGAISASPFLILIFSSNNYTQSIISSLAVIVIFLNQSKILRLFDFHLVYYFFYSLIVLLSFQAENMGTINFLALWIVGTNPVINYGLNKAKAPLGKRISSIIKPVFLTDDDDKAIESNLIKEIPYSEVALISDRGILLTDGSVEYNSIFTDKSLPLEYIWDALERNKVRFFPDWYGLFYSKYGLEIYVKNIIGNNDLFKEWMRIEISEASSKIMENQLKIKHKIKLEMIFGVETVGAYFPNEKYMYISEVS